MDEKTSKISQELSSVLVAFQNINAPMTIKNIQYSNFVVNNIQNILQVLQKSNDELSKKNDT